MEHGARSGFAVSGCRITEPRQICSVSMSQRHAKKILENLERLRERSKISRELIEERLILGPGWIERFESGLAIPGIDDLAALAHAAGGTLADLLTDLPENTGHPSLNRQINAEPVGTAIDVKFKYAVFDATYRLANSTVEQFESVLKILRDELSKLSANDAELNKAIKTEAVAGSFLKAVELWPDANPSDIWWFIIYRAYCDPYNHPANFARLDLTQSWKRTSGWALEEVLVRHYAPHLRKHGIRLHIASGAEKQRIVDSLDVGDRIEADKIDVVIAKDDGSFQGVVHVKASFAERRTDDVPMSSALMRAGYLSPLWTMDCKSMPGERPKNRGELGATGSQRSAKRKDIEDEGYFTGCFSYNSNTQASSNKLPPERRIYVCNFKNPDDAFSKFIINHCQKNERGA